MVVVSCSGKFHAFALAEQLSKSGQLAALFTMYASKKNNWLKKLARRNDYEDIPIDSIKTAPLLAFPARLMPGNSFLWNDLFDAWVGRSLHKQDYTTFIGWSGMSLRSVNSAKSQGKVTVLERGSSHIEYQERILREEFLRFGRQFSIDKRVIDKEKKEYATADYISVPSKFVRQSFIDEGVAPEKLLLNPYGAPAFMQQVPIDEKGKENKFTILYLGSLQIRKGLSYFFEALEMLSLPDTSYEVWFIGKVFPEMQEIIVARRRSNWKFFGHLPQIELKEKISRCHMAVQPSLEEGLSMVIPQMMAAGLPVVATVNTGAEDVISDGDTGFIVPIRSPKSIAEKIELLFSDKIRRDEIANRAYMQIQQGFTWDDYGARYLANLRMIEHRR